MNSMDPLGDAHRHLDRLDASEAECADAYRFGCDQMLKALMSDPSLALHTPTIGDPRRHTPAYELAWEYLGDVPARMITVLRVLNLLDKGQGDTAQARLLAQSVLLDCVADYGNFCADRREEGML